ncbi:purine-cytosine permease family protein [Celerinatantimonas sp. MCCC 1A17872]|uniref:purine-cytosine permease family protein n=1 Tax=Celerinatantimonas sp. MCCC 1A17872 TaxID=3177514 RepID=UPI0038CB687D
MMKKNQDLASYEDDRADEYANSPVPESDKSVSALSIFNVMLGVSTALIWFSLGAQLVHSFGTINFLIGATVTAAIVGLISFIWVNFASKSGFNSDLITRASGFGYLGSTVTALIFALNNLLYFGMEGGIMINAVHTYFPAIPILLLQIICGLLFIPLTCFGVKLVSRIMWLSLPVLFLFFILIAHQAASIDTNLHFWSIGVSSQANLLAGSPILQVMVAMFGISGIGATASDFGRFIPSRHAKIGGVMLGPVFTLFTFLVPLLFGAWLGASFKESDPAVYFTQSFGALGVLVVVLTQARINTNNVYSAAVSLATVANRLLHLKLARLWWVVISCILCVLILTADLYSKATVVLGIWGIVLIAWVGTVFADILINRYLLKLSSEHYYYDQHQLCSVNPVGFTALIIALVSALPLSFGIAGPFGTTIAPFVAFAATVVVTPLMAIVTKGRFASRIQHLELTSK